MRSTLEGFKLSGFKFDRDRVFLGQVPPRITGIKVSLIESSGADPDPYVLGPPGSGSGFISTRYGSGSFYNQAEIVRKTLIPTVL